MDAQKIEMFMATNGKCFPSERLVSIKEKLDTLDDSKFAIVSATDFKDPTTILLISIFIGGWGVDRFMLGDIGMGVLKLLTGGLCGILWLIDIINISKKTKEHNYNLLMQVL